MSPSFSPSSESCSTIIYDMIDCIPFLSGDDTEGKPTLACCAGFKIVVEINDECICEAFKSSVDLGVYINLTKAAALPLACQVSTHSISTCNITVNPPMGESPIPLAPSNSGSREAPAPAPAAPADEVTKHVPSSALYGTNSLSSSFFALFNILLISLC
ncbi:hypothetical protein V6N13_012139 [Hibiscus sabdariffa]|uniref:Bifunctional inhibitor/plant lipid transfer protein/seed storage helical domain-containing protein n=1 Tax=Hibiscus sabdariffa TaxID=183260 RepID=A0ABR2SEF8_9ROSI